MATSEMTVSEMYLSLTGYDEKAIAKFYGSSIEAIAQNGDDEYASGRALVFINQRRRGLSDQDAYNAVLELSKSQVNDYFTPESADPLGEESAPDAQ